MTTRWKPEPDECYWYITAYMETRSHWYDDVYSVPMFNNGNCFKTKEQAEEALEKIKQVLLEAHDGSA